MDDKPIVNQETCIHQFEMIQNGDAAEATCKICGIRAMDYVEDQFKEFNVIAIRLKNSLATHDKPAPDDDHVDLSWLS